MASSFLTHGSRSNGKRCGGNVVIDVSEHAKLYAPSFSFSNSGIGNLLLDVEVIASGGTIPKFFCKNCGDKLHRDDIEKSVTAVCQICGSSAPVSDIKVHPSLSCICSKCEDQIVTYNKTGVGSEKIHGYVTSFGLSKRLNLVPLIEVLSTPITI